MAVCLRFIFAEICEWFFNLALCANSRHPFYVWSQNSLSECVDTRPAGFLDFSDKCHVGFRNARPRRTVRRIDLRRNVAHLAGFSPDCSPDMFGDVPGSQELGMGVYALIYG